MEKTIQIGDIEVNLKCTASTPRVYRLLFGTDIFHDISKIQGLSGGVSEQIASVGEGIDTMNQIAYAMAKQADSGILPFDEWLDQFGMMDIMAVTGDIMELWGSNMVTNAQSKKKPGASTGK